MEQNMRTWADVQAELQNTSKPLSNKISRVASNIVGIHPSSLMDSTLGPSRQMTIAWICVKLMVDAAKVSKIFQCISSELKMCTSLNLKFNLN